MRAVVTGAGGFVGRHVVRRLAVEGFPVLAVDRAPWTGPELRGIERRTVDLARPESVLPEGWATGEPFALVHLAWDMRREVADAQAPQPGLLAGLLEAWQDRGLAYVVGMGSAEEYGRREGVLRESDPPVGALTPYGAAKIEARELATGWAASNGLDLLWLRPFIVYGPGQSGTMLIPYAIEQARNRRHAGFTDGLQKRDFIHVADVAEAVARAVLLRPEGRHIANVGTGCAVPIRDLILEIARRFHTEEQFVLGERPRRPGEPEVQEADITRAKQLLDWGPAVKWRDAIAQLCGPSKD